MAERMVSGGAGLLFKGSGFYLTDYGKNAHQKKGPAESKTDGAKAEAGKSEGASSASSESSGTSKSSESKPAESKPAAPPKPSGE
jgi:predicted nucleic acid-binding Zn ribbon protein